MAAHGAPARRAPGGELSPEVRPVDMSPSPGSGRPGRRRPLVAGLNLVAYIDLLTCMIAFLLITAVWTQLARIETAQKPPGGDGEDDRGVEIVVMVGEAGFNVLADQDRQVLPRGGAGHDFQALAAALAKLKASYPDKNDALVTSDDAITFDVLIRTMDSVLTAGFPSVSLADPSNGNIRQDRPTPHR